MTVSHQDAIELEHIVLSAYQKDHAGAFGGFIAADRFEDDPFFAAILVLAPLYYQSPTDRADQTLGTFLSKWKTVFDYPDGNKQYTFDMYSKELKETIKALQ